MQNKKGELHNAINNLKLLGKKLIRKIETPILTKSIPHLQYILEKENTRFHYPQETVESCAKYLTQKGIAIPSIQQITKKQDRSKTRDIEQPHDNCYFYVKNLSLSNVRQLIQKVHQYNIFTNIQTIMCEYQDIDIDYTLEQIKPSKQGTLFRNQNKFKQYNQIVSTFIASSINRQPVSSSQLLRLFAHASKNQMWNLIVKMFNGVNVEGSYQQIQRQLINNSVQLLEEEYNRKIPSDYRGFEIFVHEEYINKLGHGKNYVHYNRQGRPIWAIVFTLLRAGRLDDIKNLEGQMEYSKLFADFYSYVNGEDREYKMDGINKDIFLTAIYSIFNQKLQCSLDILNDERDFIWFTFKTTILNQLSSQTNNYNKSQMTLCGIQEQITNRYISKPNLYNYTSFIYCLAFDKLVKPNSYFDQDDTGHFLLFLHLIFGGQDNGIWNHHLRTEFYERIANYSQQLITNNIFLSFDYTIVSVDGTHNSVQSVLNSISDLLIYNQLVQRFFGSTPSLDTPIQVKLREGLQPTIEEYNQFITKTINKYASTSKNYIYPAKVYEYLLLNTNKSVEFLLDVLVKDIMGTTTFTEGDVGEITALISRIQSHERLTGAYNRLLQFIQMTKYLKDIIILDQPIQQIIFQSKYSPIQQDELSHASKQILLDLSNTEYISIYAVFLHYFVKATERFYSYKPQKAKEYRDAIRGMRRHYQNLREHGLAKGAGLAYRERMGEVEKELDFIKV